MHIMIIKKIMIIINIITTLYLQVGVIKDRLIMAQNIDTRCIFAFSKHSFGKLKKEWLSDIFKELFILNTGHQYLNLLDILSNLLPLERLSGIFQDVLGEAKLWSTSL